VGKVTKLVNLTCVGPLHLEGGNSLGIPRAHAAILPIYG